MAICLKHKVEKLYGFGSAIHQTEPNDVDLQLILNKHPAPCRHGENIWRFWDAMEGFFWKKGTFSVF